MILDNLKELEAQQKLQHSIVLWGIGNQTLEVITWLKNHGHGEQLLFIIDNFKRTFCQRYEGISVAGPDAMSFS